MPRRSLPSWLLLAPLACSPAAPTPSNPPEPLPLPTIDVGPGELEAYGWYRDGVVLCLRAESPRLVSIPLPDGPATDLPWPLGNDARCDRVAIGDTLVCIAGYDAGIGCIAKDGDGQVLRPAIDGPPTGLAWDDRGLWIGTDGAGLWRWSPTGVAQRVIELPDLTSGLAAGPFGIVWGTGGEFVWRTRVLRRGMDQPEWLRPPLPPNVECDNEPEVCEWVSNAVGTYRGLVWFTAVNAPAPLYAWHPQDGTWAEFQTVGELHVGPSGALAVRDDGSLESYSPREEHFVELAVRLEPGDAPVAARGGLWALAGGRLRLLVSNETR